LEEVTRIIDNMERVIIGKRRVIQRLITALLCGGHVIIEDVPGVGKTTLAKALARSMHPVHAGPFAFRHSRHNYV